MRPIEGVGRPRSASPVLAFFDLDGTLIAGQTTMLMVRFFRRERVVGIPFLLGTALWFLAYKAGLVKITDESRSKSASILLGLTPSQVERLMEGFTEELMMPKLHRAASLALARHMAEGDRVVVVSAALAPVVKALCKRLHVTDYVGTSCEVEAGRYTGRLLDPMPYGEEKAAVIVGLMERWGADPSACWAYADSETDLAFLRSVGHPVAVNPRPALLEVAEQSGWPVLV